MEIEKTSKSRPNPTPSAIFEFSQLGTSSVKVSLASSLRAIFALCSGKPFWTGLTTFRPLFSEFSEAGREGKGWVNFSSSPNNGRFIASV
jgi:hypothetical protein